jgi:intracellular multiplication protein IcmP
MSDNKTGASEAALGWGILAAVFGALFYLIWWYFSTEIKDAIRWLRYGEMWIVSLFVSDDFTVNWKGQDIDFDSAMKMAREMPADQINGDFLSLISTVAMTPYLYIVFAFTLGFALWTLFRGPGSEHRESFNLDSLIKKQANIFPIIAPMINFNPAKLPSRAPGAPVPAELPMFAEALSPEEWVAYYSIPAPDGKIDEETAHKAFAKQLGQRWRGAKHLEPYMQVILAGCCLKAARKRNDSDALMGRLAKCWDGNKGLNLSIDKTLLKEARAVIANKDISGSVLRKCNEHAWETTALIRALATARDEGGVLAPAQFIWLRGHNRDLWYPLNNLGRQSYHMEAIGAMAHYKAEKLAQRPIPRPKVTDAVKTLSEYMASSKARAIPQLDYSNSKKRGVQKLKTA